MIFLGIVTKKLSIVLILFVIVAIVLIALAMLLTPQNNVNNTLDSDGLFASQKATAINIALSDPTIKSKIMDHPGNSHIGNVILSRNDGESGYMNSADLIANVPFQFWGSQSFTENEKMTIYVDLNTSKVLGNIWYSYRGFPIFAEITIPPGAYWYNHMVGGIVSSNNGLSSNGTLETSTMITKIEPENASIYPTIVDKEDLNKFLNNSPYQALTYYDNIDNKTTSTKGDIAYCNNWSAQINLKVPLSSNGSSWPNYDIPDIYLILRNGNADRNIVVSLQ